MKAITEDELDILMVIILLFLALASIAGNLPIVAQLFPNMMSLMYRVIDMIKDINPILTMI